MTLEAECSACTWCKNGDQSGSSSDIQSSRKDLEGAAIGCQVYFFWFGWIRCWPLDSRPMLPVIADLISNRTLGLSASVVQLELDSDSSLCSKSLLYEKPEAAMEIEEETEVVFQTNIRWKSV